VSGPSAEHQSQAPAQPPIAPVKELEALRCGLARADAALRAGEARYRALVKNISVAVYEADPNDPVKATFLGPQFAGLLGLPPEECHECPGLWLRYVHPEDRDRVLAEVRRVSVSKSPFSMEYRLVAHDGRLVWVRDEGRWVRDAATGQYLTLQGMLLDITERKAAEVALKASERRYRALAETGTFAVWRASPSGAVLELHGWERQTGQPAEAHRDDGWLTMVHPEDREATAHAWATARAAHRPAETEYRVLICGGEWRWVRGRAVPAFDESDGALVEWIGVVEDIHERKAAEATLAESEARFRSMADGAPVMIWVTDLTGSITFLNRCWYEFTGQTEGAGLGQGWLDALHPEDRGWVKEAWQTTHARLAAFQAEYRLRSAAGAWRWVIDAAEPRLGADGALLGYVGSVIDITDRREAEERLRETDKLNALGRLTGGIAHDFNNLLTVISGNLEFLEEDLDPGAEAMEAVKAAARAARSAAELIDRLLAFARQRPLAPSAVDANTVVSDVMVLAQRSLGERVRTETTLANGLPPVTVDRAQLENAPINLALNARDAMPEGGTLRLRTALAPAESSAERPASLSPRDYLVVSVADTGCGIPPEHLPRVLEPFFTTKPAGQGTGLGLAVVYGVVRQSGGEIVIDSVPGEGTTVRLFLPVGDPAGGTSRALAAAALEPGKTDFDKP
jgi:PAS domain S-box-containing protein